MSLLTFMSHLDMSLHSIMGIIIITIILKIYLHSKRDIILL